MTVDRPAKKRIVSSDRIYWTLTILVAALLANPLVLGGLVRSSPSQPQRTVSDPGYQQLKIVEISRRNDAGKPGPTRSTLQYVGLSQLGNTQGRSPDELRLAFDSDARILGVHVSIDVPPAFNVVEIMVGINNNPGYSPNIDADFLLHVSYANSTGTSGNLDETIWIPGGIELSAGDFVGVGGWIGTHAPEPVTVFPEIIVFYQWIDP